MFFCVCPAQLTLTQKLLSPYNNISGLHCVSVHGYEYESVFFYWTLISKRTASFKWITQKKHPMAQCYCVFWQHRGRPCLGKDFPRAISCVSMCSHTGRALISTLRKHMVSFPFEVATCVPDRAWHYRAYKMNTHRRKCTRVENMQQASNFMTF